MEGFRSTLFQFIEKYFQSNGYHFFNLIIKLSDPNPTQKLNFFYSVGFNTEEVYPDQGMIILRREL